MQNDMIITNQIGNELNELFSEGAKCGAAFVKFVIKLGFYAQPKIREIREIRGRKKRTGSIKKSVQSVQSVVEENLRYLN
jgi:hypothetical protein